MKHYSLVLIAAFFGTTNLLVRCSDGVKPFTFSTMKASLYPFEFVNMRVVMDRLVREGENRPILECAKPTSGLSRNKKDGFNMSFQSGCFLTTKKEGGGEAVIASRVEDGVAQEAHVFVCGTVDKTNEHGATIGSIKQATMVATTSRGFSVGLNGREARSRTSLLVSAAVANLKKRGYERIALSCGRVETDDLFLGCGIDSTGAPFSVYDETCAVFDPAYCPALTCSKLACTEHTN
ncbi:hypothetical protein JST99_03810 [Candidatus Dependentiae bacterium]|nr:hypothetical protein [Candidatus Dependentiae bacterium]MCC7414470.1 hypothetical protein [Campylobacterota bacterium]